MGSVAKGGVRKARPGWSRARESGRGAVVAFQMAEAERRVVRLVRDEELGMIGGARL